MVQFAPVHPATLFLYDPATRKSQRIYPPKSDPFRQAFSQRLEKVIDQTRCRENDWPCDPNDFESSIVHPIEVNDETYSLALRVDFRTQGFLPRHKTSGSGEWDDSQYVYVYMCMSTSSTRSAGESFPSTISSPRFGSDSLKNLLGPAKLSQVFATPPPR
jgi:hypothetical protein